MGGRWLFCFTFDVLLVLYVLMDANGAGWDSMEANGNFVWLRWDCGMGMGRGMVAVIDFFCERDV